MTTQNVILILADDLGFSDIGCYGGEIRTPALDALGRAGVRASNFYNTARCSPSRASLLTGLHPHQTGIGVLTRSDAPEGYAGTLQQDVATIAEMLRPAGWTTWLSGKWHLCSQIDEPNEAWPTRRGFDRFFGTLAGCSSFYEPQTLTRGEERASDAADDPDFYYTDALSDEAAKWIREEATTGGRKPFFLYLAYTAPHWPLHAAEDAVERYAEVFDDGWDDLRRRRLDRLIEEGILPPDTSLSDRDPSQPAWSNTEAKEWQTRRMQVYAAQVEQMDRGIGRVLAALDETGQRDDTLVIFLSDNGASCEELPIGNMESFVLKDEGMRRPTRAGRPMRVGNAPDIVPGPEDTYASYGGPWANLSNTPFRYYKRWVHEGGISTPLIVSWPAGDLADGAIMHEPFQLVDVVPTILEAAHVSAHEVIAARGGPALPGRSMLGSLRAQAPRDDALLYWEHIGNAAIRRGRWKLVRAYPGLWELYDLTTDRAELDDRASDHPQIVEELSARWAAWAEAAGVRPWDRLLDVYRRRGVPLELAEE